MDKKTQESIEMVLKFLDSYNETANGSEYIIEFLHRWESDKSQAPTEQIAQEELIKSLDKIHAYLAMVPIGNKSMTGVYSKNFGHAKKKLYEQCGGICQLCGGKFQFNQVVAHHTNYYKADDSRYLRLVCFNCHKNIGLLTGLVRWIAITTGTSYPPPQPSNLRPRISRRSPKKLL